MHRKVETTVKGGKNGEPMSHWRAPGWFPEERSSFGQRTRTVAVSHDGGAIGSNKAGSVLFIFTCACRERDLFDDVATLCYLHGPDPV